MVFYSLLMTLSATSHGDFHHNVVGGMLLVCGTGIINSLHLRALLNPVLWDDLQDFDNSSLNLRDWNIDEFVQGCPLKRALVESTGSPPQSPPESEEWARPRSDRATLHALLWCDLLSFHNFLHDLWHREVHNLCLLEHKLSHLCDFFHDLSKTVVEKENLCSAMNFIRC